MILKQITIIFILTFCCKNTYSQEMTSLKTYIINNNLYDYGYGLEHYETPLDSVFDYSCFVDSNIKFKNLKSLKAIDGNKDVNIKLNVKKGGIRIVSFQNGKHVVNKAIDKNLIDLVRVDKIFKVDYNNKSYILIYLSDNFSLMNKRGNYLGVLVDLKANIISIFPKLQNTNSILCLSDIDSDNSIDYISYLPVEGGLITIYSLQEGKFIMNEKYSSTLENSDGYIWTINPEGKDFISKQYIKGLCRRK